MAALCHAFRLTPADYRALTLEEHAAFARLLDRLSKGR
jgi:hypothetical protein